nr:LacI family DNA-binding transcriptional regulator [Massilia sp. JS1662]
MSEGAKRSTSQPRRKPIAGVTLEDVAARAGVSPKTVSRVVNSEPNVRPETSRAVKKAILELNYSPNLSARNLAGNRAFLIAAVYDNPNDSYVVSLLNSALQATEQLGYSLIFRPARFDSAHLVRDVMDFTRHRRLSGLVLIPPLSDDVHLLDALDLTDVRYARISPRDMSRPGPVVTIDHRRASFEMTQFLIAQGHRRIGFIKGSPSKAAAMLRMEGFLDAHRENSLPVDDALIVQGAFSFESGQESAKVLLNRPARPTAIFASNDDMAAGVLYVAHQLGLQVPADLSVVGFDDSPLACRVWPSLTTVRQPLQEMAEYAVRMLIAEVSNRAPNASEESNVKVLSHELIVRDSTARARVRS